MELTLPNQKKTYVLAITIMSIEITGYEICMQAFTLKINSKNYDEHCCSP